MNSTSEKLTDDLEQQLFELVYGLLEPAEAQALRRRVTSEPDVARAYARVVQQSERLAVAAQWEEPPLPLAAMLEAAGRLVDDEETELATGPIAGGKPAAGVSRSETTTATTAAVTAKSTESQKPEADITPAPHPRWDRWLAALAGGLVAAAVIIAACLISPSATAPGIATNHLLIGVSTKIAPEQSTVAIVSGPPAEEFSFSLRGRDGRLYEEGKGTLDASGLSPLNVRLPRDAEGPVTLNVQAAHAAAVEATIEVRAEAAPVTAALDVEHDFYSTRGVVRASIRAVGAKDLPADTRLRAQDQRGMVLEAEGEIVNGVGEYKLKLPANAVPGPYVAWAEGAHGNALGFNSFYVGEELREQDRKADDKWAATSGGERFGMISGGGSAAGYGGPSTYRMRYSGGVGGGGGGFGAEGMMRGVEPRSVAGVREEARGSHTESLASDSKSGAQSEDDELVQPAERQFAGNAIRLQAKSEALKKSLVAVVKQNGRVLASRAIEPAEAKGEKDSRGPIEVPVPATASGRMQLEIIDTDGESPKLISEYSVERTKETTFTATVSPVMLQSGDALFDVDVRDKSGRPLGETRLGVRVQFLPLDGLAVEEARQLDDLQGLEAAEKEESKVAERLKQRWYFPDMPTGLASSHASLSEDHTTPVSLSLRSESELFTTYRRRFPAGGLPPSMVLDGDSVRFVQPAEQLTDSKHRYLRGDEANKQLDQVKQLAGMTATSKTQFVNSSGVLQLEDRDGTAFADEAKSVGLDEFARESAPAAWPWAAIFAGLGGGVIVLAGGVALVRRPDPWLVWLPAGMVTLACVGAALWFGSQLDSTSMAAGNAKSEPLAALAISPSPDPAFPVPMNPTALRFNEGLPELEQLAELPPLLPYEAGGEPSNDMLKKLEDRDAPAKLPAPREPAADTPPPADPASADRPLAVPETRPVVPAGGPQPLAEASPKTPEIASGPAPPPIIQNHPAVSGVQPMGNMPSYQYGTEPTRGGQTYALGLESGRERTLIWEPAATTDANGRARILAHRPPGPGYYKLKITADRDGESVTTERIIKVEK